MRVTVDGTQRHVLVEDLTALQFGKLVAEKEGIDWRRLEVVHGGIDLLDACNCEATIRDLLSRYSYNDEVLIQVRVKQENACLVYLRDADDKKTICVSIAKTTPCADLATLLAERGLAPTLDAHYGVFLLNAAGDSVEVPRETDVEALLNRSLVTAAALTFFVSHDGHLRVWLPETTLYLEI